MESIGIVNAQGNTVIQPKPRQIKLKDGGETLELYTGRSYHVLVGARKGEVVRPGDYVGENNTFRTAVWLIRNTDAWVSVK